MANQEELFSIPDQPRKRTLEFLDNEIEKELAGLADGKEKEIARALKDGLKEIKSIIADTFEKFSVGGELTANEMRKYQRLFRLEKNIIEQMKPYFKEITSILDKYPTEYYSEAFFRQEWKFSQFSGVEIDFGALNFEQVSNVLDNKFDNIAIKDFTDKFGSGLKKILNNGIITGQSYQKMASELTKLSSITMDQAMRILRTELATSRNQATKDGYDKAEKSGIKGEKIWDAALDARTRQTHGHLDGVAADENGNWDLGGTPNVPYPAWGGLPAGERINCRCTLRFNPSGFTPKIRRTREEGIIPYQTYDEYFSSSGKKLFD